MRESRNGKELFTRRPNSDEIKSHLSNWKAFLEVFLFSALLASTQKLQVL